MVHGRPVAVRLLVWKRVDLRGNGVENWKGGLGHMDCSLCICDFVV